MFEEHQHKEQFLEDMSQKQEINKFSEESQRRPIAILLQSMALSLRSIQVEDQNMVSLKDG